MLAYHRARWAALVVGASLLTACSSGSNAPAPAPSVPPRIVAASAGTISGTSPSSDGRVWALGGTRNVKTLTEIRMRDGEVLNIAPASAASTAVAQSVTGQLIVGTATATAGTVEFHNGSTGAVLDAIPLPAPVISLAAGDDGATFYALNGHNSRLGNDNVAVIDSQNQQVQKSIPAPPASVALEPTPDQTAVYVLTRFGQVNEISVASGAIEAQFNLNMIGVGLAMAPSGQTLFVLGGPSDARAIALVDLKTDSVSSVVAAAGNSVAIAPGVDDRHVFDYVGTPKVGNVQVIQLPSV
jgi:hypothetical protein